MKKKILFIIAAVIVLAVIFFVYVSQTDKGLLGSKPDNTTSSSGSKEPNSLSNVGEGASSGAGSAPAGGTEQSPAQNLSGVPSKESAASKEGAQGGETISGRVDAAAKSASGASVAEASSPMVIDLNILKEGKGGKLSALMAERKKRWGLKDSVDVIATGDEKVKVGDFEISLDSIKKNLQMSEGKIMVEDIDRQGASVRKTLTYFGVRLVRPGDNLWDVHFKILKEYLAARGFKVSPVADEPVKNGRSTGVGKVLKFAENMVMVFNLETKTPPNDLNLLRPGTEVVIFNFTPIFQLLNSVDFSKLDTIHFNGKVLYLEPA